MAETNQPDGPEAVPGTPTADVAIRVSEPLPAVVAATVPPADVAQLLTALTRVVDSARVTEKPEGRLELVRTRVTTIVRDVTTAAKVLLLVCGALLLWFVIREVRKDVWQIESIAVPESWEQRGYSSRVVAALFRDEIRRLTIAADTGSAWSVALKQEEDFSELEIPGAGVSTGAVLGYARAILNRYPTSITGEVVFGPGNDAFLTIRMRGGANREIPAETIRGSKDEPAELIRNMAAFVVRQGDPCELVSAYLGLREFAKSLDVIEDCLYRRSGADRAWAHNAWGIALLELHQNSAAIDQFEKTLALDSQFAHALNNWGFALANEREYDKAIEKYDAAIKVDPKLVLAYNNWGNALLEKRQYQEALQKYTQALAIDSRDTGALINRGRALALAGDRQGSVTEFEKALEIDPRNPYVYSNWGFSLLKRMEYREAAIKYRKAIELDPRLVNPHVELGDVLLQLGDRPGAIAAYEKAVALDPQASEATRAREALSRLRAGK